MVGDFVACDIPIRDEGVVRVRERSEVGHLHWASIRVLAMRKELVDRIQGVRLNRIVCSEKNELRNLGLIVHQTVNATRRKTNSRHRDHPAESCSHNCTWGAGTWQDRTSNPRQRRW